MSRKKVVLAEPLGNFRLSHMPKYMQRFYLLYKQCHLTDQDYKAKCALIGHRPMENIDDFIETLRDYGFMSQIMFGFIHREKDMRKWVMEHWSHFNPNIQEKIAVEYPVKDKRTKSGTRLITKLI